MAVHLRSGQQRGRRRIVMAATLALAAASTATVAHADTPAQAPAGAKYSKILAQKNHTLYHRSADATSSRFTTTTGSWSLIAVHPDADNDFDISVSGNGVTQASRLGRNATDVVLVDGAHADPANYTTTVTRYGSGSGGYDVAFDEKIRDQDGTPDFPVHDYGDETVSGGGDVWPTDMSVAQGPDGKVAAIFQVTLEAGQDYLLTARQNRGNLALFQSVAGDPLQGWSDAVVKIPTGKNCAWFRPSTSDVYGMVVRYDDGNGGYLSYWQYVDVVAATPAQALAKSLKEGCGPVVTGR